METKLNENLLYFRDIEWYPWKEREIEKSKKKDKNIKLNQNKML